MQYILEKRIEHKIFTDECEYFFTFLNDRFEYTVELWIKELEKKFNKKFKPIWILSSKQNNIFKKNNFIIINKELKKIKKDHIVYLEDYEDINKEFSESKFINQLIDKLSKKQDRVFILGFTSSHLNIKNSKVKILGPSPKIATLFDNKIEHVKLFRHLNLPRNKTRIYKNITAIKQNEKYPFYISASYTSGGHESETIYSEKDLNKFYLKIRKINRKHPFLVANLITSIKLSPNINAIVCGKNDTRIVCITDQILRGNQYLGNIYPTKATTKERVEMIKITKKVGNYLAEQGFKGAFGLDYIIDFKKNIFPVDLNPRRQGGYLTNICMALPKINIPRIELKIALGESIPDFDYGDFQTNIVWAHSKIKPYQSNVRILNHFEISKPQYPFKHIGATYKAIFYSKGDIIMDGNAGYLIVSGNNYEKIKNKIITETENLLIKNFKKENCDSRM